MEENNNVAETAVQVLPNLNDLLAYYPEDQVEMIMEHKDKFNKVLKTFDKMSNTIFSSTVVMTCASRTCPYRDVCILLKNEIAPEGGACPVEKKVIAELEFDVINSLKIDRNDPIEMELLWDLIDLKLLDMRASGYMKNGSVVQVVESKIGHASSTREELAPALVIKMDLKRIKHSIIDQFVATRRAKKKYGMSNDSKTLEEMLMTEISRKKVKDQDVEDISD